jgi:hypothetical protein
MNQTLVDSSSRDTSKTVTQNIDDRSLMLSSDYNQNQINNSQRN